MSNPISANVAAGDEVLNTDHNLLRTDVLKVYPSLTNKSGGPLSEGDVFIWDSTNDLSITTTSTAKDLRVGGVIASGGANNAQVYAVPFGSIGVVNVQGNVGRMDVLVTSSTPGRAMGGVGKARRVGMLGYALTSYSGGGAGTVMAMICPSFDQFGALVVPGTPSVNSGGDSGSPQTLISGFSISGLLKVAVAAIWNVGNAGSDITTPTLGGVTMSVAGYSKLGNDSMGLYYLINPADGSPNLVATASAGSSGSWYAWMNVFYGGGQSVVNNLAVQTGTSQNPAGTITCTADGYILCMLLHQSTTTVNSRGSGQNSLVDASYGSKRLVLDYIYPSLETSRAFSWGMSGSAGYELSACGVQAA